MPTYLVLNCQLRTETDPQTIANLERKGWVMAPSCLFSRLAMSL